jgi:hypothetical protein
MAQFFQHVGRDFALAQAAGGHEVIDQIRRADGRLGQILGSVEYRSSINSEQRRGGRSTFPAAHAREP